MQKNIFDREISIYNGVIDTRGVICKLRTFLFDKKHIEEIARLRSLPTKEARNAIKKRLPQACISGVFQPTRKAENLVQHSGLVCVDIDRQDNGHIENWDEVKTELSKLKEVAFVSRSASGSGYFAILPLRYPNYHRQQFEQLKRDFKGMGIVIDRACGDITRMRCLSFDPHPYINENASPYCGYYEPKPVYNYQYTDSDDVQGKVARCVEMIKTTHTDITSSYNDWFTVGCALASLGEDGRGFFHAVSSQNEKYNHVETDKKFSNLLQTGRKISVATFFSRCKDFGITFKD